MILFRDGTRSRGTVYLLPGGLAYTMRWGRKVWLVPGVSVRWVEAA